MSETNDLGPLPPHARTPPQRSRIVLWLQPLLLAAGIVLLGHYAYVTAEAALYQAQENRELNAILAAIPQSRQQEPVGPRTHPPRTGTPLGRIEIPRLGVSAIIRAGADAETLRLAVGHVSGTAFPGEDGNVALAGHRDTFFRRLRNIRADDEIRLVTPAGSYAYRVQQTTVVKPRDVWVLDPTDEPTLTLVTCYPFTYVGAAPERFIVRAHRDTELKSIPN